MLKVQLGFPHNLKHEPGQKKIRPRRLPWIFFQLKLLRDTVTGTTCRRTKEVHGTQARQQDRSVLT